MLLDIYTFTKGEPKGQVNFPWYFYGDFFFPEAVTVTAD